MKFYVYILQSKLLQKFYVGQTYDIEIRLHRHKLKTTRYTQQASDWRLVYKEEFDTRSAAMKREKEIKSKKNRKYIENLISAA